MMHHHSRVHPTTQNNIQFKTYEWFIYFWNYPFSIFGPWFIVGNWHKGKWNCREGGTAVPPCKPPYKKKVSFSLFSPRPTPPLQATSSFSQMTKREQDKILQNSLKRPKIKRAYFSNQKGQRNHKRQPFKWTSEAGELKNSLMAGAALADRVVSKSVSYLCWSFCLPQGMYCHYQCTLNGHLSLQLR